MIIELAPDLFCIKIRVSGPLKVLNSYVFIGKDRNLLIDTGFNHPDSFEDMQTGIRELSLDMKKTDLLCTHCHADHSGLVGRIEDPSAKVYMTASDGRIVEQGWENWKTYRLDCKPRYLEEGFPQELFDNAFTNNASNVLSSRRRHALTYIKDGDIIQAGSRELQVIATPGHTPGHICLYEAREKLMILADCVLFDISPNIIWWRELPNALKSYLESLKKLRSYDVTLPLPGHRTVSCTMRDRIDQLFVHHRGRLGQAKKIILDNPGIDAYRVAQGLTWKVHKNDNKPAKSWEDFPISQKWFAFGETLSHLDYLTADGAITREVKNGIAGYYTK